MYIQRLHITIINEGRTTNTVRTTPKAIIPKVEAQIDQAEGVIRPLRIVGQKKPLVDVLAAYDPSEAPINQRVHPFNLGVEVLGQYDPFKAYEKGDSIHHEFINLNLHDWQQIAQFAERYGLPQFDIRNPHEWDWLEFQQGEFKETVDLWRIIQSGQSRRLRNWLDRFLDKLRGDAWPDDFLMEALADILRPGWREERGKRLEDIARYVLKFCQLDLMCKQSDMSASDLGRYILSAIINSHLSDDEPGRGIKVRLTFEGKRPKQNWVVSDLLTSMWLMLALDILNEERIWTCARCGKYYTPKRSTKIYCGEKCARAEAQRMFRKREKERKSRVKKSKSKKGSKRDDRAQRLLAELRRS